MKITLKQSMFMVKFESGGRGVFGNMLTGEWRDTKREVRNRNRKKGKGLRK